MLKNSSRGFTLLEVILVITLIGIISLVTAKAINQNLRFAAYAQELDYLANEMIKVTRVIYNDVGGVKNIRFNDVSRESNGFLDVLFYGEAFMADKFVDSYFYSTAYPLKERVINVVTPEVDRKSGVYRPKFNTESRINIISEEQASSGQTQIQFTNIDTAVIERIKNKYEDNNRTIDNEGFIQHGDISGDRASLRYSFDIK